MGHGAGGSPNTVFWRSSQPPGGLQINRLVCFYIRIVIRNYYGHTKGIQKSLTASQLCHIIIGKIVGTIMFLAYK